MSELNRPQQLNDVIGQQRIKSQIQIIVDAAIKTHDAVPHVLLTGPAGLGKTSIAAVIANERNVDFVSLAGTSLSKPEDIKQVLATKLNMEGYSKRSMTPSHPNQIKPTVLFIDEIHNIPRKVSETLYTVMEDRIYWEGRKDPWTRRTEILKAWVPKFTLIGATTTEGMLSKPFFDRFKYHWKLERYSVEECAHFIMRTLQKNGYEWDQEGLHCLAQRSRGTARVAVNMTLQSIDVMVHMNTKKLIRDVVDLLCSMAEIDDLGLTKIDRTLLVYLYKAYRPVGVKALATFLEEDVRSLELHYEPFLVMLGFMARTPQGRVITPAGSRYLINKQLVEDTGGRYVTQ